MKRVLLTGGGTSEHIDQVRTITNTSTGRLAKQIFDLLIKEDYVVDMVCSNNIKFENEEAENVNIYRISDFASVQNCLNNLLTTKHYDLIIHAMAISDYYVDKVYDLNSLVKDIMASQYETEQELKQIIKYAASLDNSKKISSNHDNLIISMHKTTKLISELRLKQPQAIIVGCKLLDNVSEAELITVAQKQIKDNKLDFCIANDVKNIHGDIHKALILNKSGEVLCTCTNKLTIAQNIINLSKEEYHG